MRKLSARGVSVVAALVSIVIVSLIVLTVINLIGISGDVLNTFQSSIRAMDAAQEVRFALADANTCTLNFTGLDISSATRTEGVELPSVLRYPEATNRTVLSSKPIVNIDNEEGERLNLDGIYVRRSVLANMAYLDIRLRKRGQPDTAPPSHQRSLPIWITVSPTNRITCCTTLNMSACLP